MIYEELYEGAQMKLLLCSVLITFIFYTNSARSNSRFDLTFNLGPSLSQNGAIKDLGDPNLSTGFGFNFFFKPQHGVGFGYNNESSFEGSSKFPGIKDASISTFDIHYAYRFIKDRFHIVFEPGFGWQTIYDETNDYYWGYLYYDDLSTTLILNYKLFFRFIITEWDSGDTSSEGHFFVGAGIIHNFSYDDDLNGRDISGNRLAGLVQLGLGW